MGQAISVEAAELLKAVAGPSCAVLDTLHSRQLDDLLELALSGNATFSAAELAGAPNASPLLLAKAANQAPEWEDFLVLMPLASHDHCTLDVVEALVNKFCSLVPSVLTHQATSEVTRCLARLFSTGLINEHRCRRLKQAGAEVAGLVVAADELWQILESRQLGQQLQQGDVERAATATDLLSDPACSEGKIQEELRASLNSATGTLSKIGLIRHRNCPEQALNLVVDHLCSDRGGRLLSSRISLGIALRHLAACPVLQDKHVDRLRQRFELMDELWDNGIALNATRRRAATELLGQPAYLQPPLAGLLQAQPDLTLVEAVVILSAAN